MVENKAGEKTIRTDTQKSRFWVLNAVYKAYGLIGSRSQQDELNQRIGSSNKNESSENYRTEKKNTITEIKTSLVIAD